LCCRTRPRVCCGLVLDVCLDFVNGMHVCVDFVSEMCVHFWIDTLCVIECGDMTTRKYRLVYDLNPHFQSKI